MEGLDPDGLGRIACPVTILTGARLGAVLRARSPTRLAARIPGARRVELPGLRHTAPITEPEPVAAAVRAALAAPTPASTRAPARRRAPA